MTKIIFLNGPPGAGKDTAANYLYEKYDNVVTLKMAELLHIYAQEFVSLLLNEDDIVRYEDDKSLILPIINVSYRQFMIDIAEGFMKKTYGELVFGRITSGIISKIMDYDKANGEGSIIVISDSGFKEEAAPIVELIGPEFCTLVRIHRDGYNYDSDSRSYINLDEWNIKTIEVINDEIESYNSQIDNVYDIAMM
jgi:hypothetical protein